MPEAVERSYALAKRHGVVLHTFGHAGLGIVHVLLREDPAEAKRWAAAQRAKDDIVAFVCRSAAQPRVSTGSAWGVGSTSPKNTAQALN